MVSTEGEKLQTVRPGLERSRRRRRYTDRVQRTDVEDLVVELDPALAAEHDIDLFGVGVAMGERAALAGKQAKERDAGALGGQCVAGDSRFPAVSKPVCRRRVVDRGQADFREGAGHVLSQEPRRRGAHVRYRRRSLTRRPDTVIAETRVTKT